MPKTNNGKKEMGSPNRKPSKAKEQFKNNDTGKTLLIYDSMKKILNNITTICSKNATQKDNSKQTALILAEEFSI